MTSEQPDAERRRENQRLLRREIHASRAVPSIVAAVLVIALCLWGLFEAVLKSVGQPPWIVAPDRAGAWLMALPDGVPDAWLAAAGVVLLLVGAYFLIFAVLPGRRSRHVIPSDRAVVVVDDRVLAASLARRTRLQARVTPEQVIVTVSRRLVDVQIRPTSGLPVDESAVRDVVTDELRRNSVSPMPPVRIRLAQVGAIGV